MDEQIQFISSLKGFLSIKKLKVTKNVVDREVLEFLASIQVSTNYKISEYLEKIIDIKKLKELTKDLNKLDVPNFFKEINSRKIKKIINDLLPEDMDKKNKLAYVDAYKVYLIEKYSIDNNVITGYHQILFPARKKQLKKILKKK